MVIRIIRQEVDTMNGRNEDRPGPSSVNSPHSRKKPPTAPPAGDRPLFFEGFCSSRISADHLSRTPPPPPPSATPPATPPCYSGYDIMLDNDTDAAVEVEVDVETDGDNASYRHASTVEAVSSTSFDFPSHVTDDADGGAWGTAEQAKDQEASPRGNLSNGFLRYRRPSSLSRKVRFSNKQVVHEQAQEDDSSSPGSPRWSISPDIDPRASHSHNSILPYSSFTTDVGSSATGGQRNMDRNSNTTRHMERLDTTMSPRRMARPSTLPPRAATTSILPRPQSNRRASFAYSPERSDDITTTGRTENGGQGRVVGCGGESFVRGNRRNSMPAFFRKVLNPKPLPALWNRRISPKFLYLAEEENTGTEPDDLKLCHFAAMSPKYYPGNLVHQGMPFVVRVVGTHFPNTARRGLYRVCLSEAFVIPTDPLDPNRRMQEVHDIGKKVSFGYHSVSTEKSTVVDLEEDPLVVKELTLKVVLGETGSEDAIADKSVSALKNALAEEGRNHVNTDIRWQLVGANHNVEEDGGGKGRKVRRPLRYGYYFILSGPCDLKLFCATATPEHMRLVAQTIGEPKTELVAPTKSLSYVVVRVSED